MKRYSILIISLLILSVFSYSQEFQWKAGLNYFFDNTEYSKSTLTNDKTMTGVHFSPEIGLKWDTNHSIFVGTDLLRISGSDKIIDIAQPIAYYRFEKENKSFYAGVFPRTKLLSNYSDLFFQDSINNFRPTMQGLFWQVGNNSSYFNLWLDWTGHETSVLRESFFVGASGHKNINLMFVDFQSYMFHFANTLPHNPLYYVHDNALAHLSTGLSYSNNTGIDTLLLAIGVLAGLERDRAFLHEGHTPIGAVIRLNVDYKGIGTQNTLYTGNPRNLLYSSLNEGLYWNNPFLRAGFYLQSKWYLNVIRNKYVDGKLGLNLHFSEGKVMYEQVFTLRAQIDNNYKESEEVKPTLMSGWFN